MALTMNNPESRYYQILGWSGLNHLPKEPPAKLAPMQATAFSQPDALFHLKNLPGLEGYRAWVDQKGGFRIVPALQAQTAPSGFESAANYSIMINLGNSSVRLQ
jgi:hypothetical protein